VRAARALSLESLIGFVNRGASRGGDVVPSTLDVSLPHGRWFSWCHYGVMVPDLPDPHGFFTLMSIVGTPGVRIFANEHGIRTTARDTAYVVSGTAEAGADAFDTFSIAADCEIRGDGSVVRFGDELVLDGRPPRIAVRRTSPRGSVSLDLAATGAITRFVDVPGVYRHWSLLCRYVGTVGSPETPVRGLCTYEYAAGVGTSTFLPDPARERVQLPGRFFTYQVLNLDDQTQILLTMVRGPRGIPILRGCYVRTLDDGSLTYQDCEFSVRAHDPGAATSPTGINMRLPAEFTWRVRHSDHDLLELTGRPDRNWLYGLGRGYAGSFAYDGRFRGAPISGRGYIEYIDCE
jgi:uncharacterized protein DUF6670